MVWFGAARIAENFIKKLSKEFFRLQTVVRKLESGDNGASDSHKQIEDFDNLYHNAMLQAKLKKYEIVSPLAINSATPNLKLPVVTTNGISG